MSFAGIDYTVITYVQLRLLNRFWHEVAEFRRSLRGCFEHWDFRGPEERLQIYERVRLLFEYFHGTWKETPARDRRSYLPRCRRA